MSLFLDSLLKMLKVIMAYQLTVQPACKKYEKDLLGIVKLHVKVGFQLIGSRSYLDDVL